MHTLLLLTLLSTTDAGTPATLTELLDCRDPSPELTDWRRRADEGHLAFQKSWSAAQATAKTPEDARAAFAMLVDYAMNLRNDDGASVVTRLLALDDVQRGFDAKTSLLVSLEQRATVHQTAVERARRSPTNEVLWKLSLESAPDDDDAHSLELATSCVAAIPSSRSCRAVVQRLQTPRCVKGDLRAQLRWVHKGRTLTPETVAELVFKPNAPSDVLVKLAADAPAPAFFMIRTPMSADDIQLFDGDTLIGYAQPPATGEKTVALRTIGATLDETVKLLCAKPTVTQPAKR